MDLYQIQAFFDWLNTKGTRENQLEKAIVKWKGHLLNGMKQRLEVRPLFLFMHRRSETLHRSCRRVFMRPT
jgi:hypothetical protein